MKNNNIKSYMDELILEEKAQFGKFVDLFFELLERRQLTDSQNVVDVMREMYRMRLHDTDHYQAILLFEKRHFDRAEVLLRDLLADKQLSSEQRARAMRELAIQLSEQGQWAEAQQLLERASAIYQDVENPLELSKTYNNLGINISFQVEQKVSDAAQLQKALHHHQEALRLSQQLKKPWEIAKNWHGLGKVYGLLGQYTEALDAFNTYISMCEEMNDLSDQAMGLSDLAALVHIPQKQYDDAATALDKAIRIYQKPDDLLDEEYDIDPLNLAEALTRRGNLLAEQCRFDAALQSYERALLWADTISAQLEAPIVQASYRATADFIYTAPLSLHLAQGDAMQAFTTAERARSRVLAGLLMTQNDEPSQDISDELQKQRRTLRNELQKAYDEDSDSEDLRLLEKRWADLDRLIELQGVIAADLAETEPLTASEVQQRLPPDSIILTYVSDAEDRIWALTLTATDAQVTLIKNVSIRWLQDYLIDHLDGARRGILVPHPRTNHLSQPHLFPSLYKALIEPVQEILEQAKHVHIIPTGPLHYIPIGALLPDPTSEPLLLADERHVSYAPSATVLINYCYSRPPSSKKTLLSVAPDDESLHFTRKAAEFITSHSNGKLLLDSEATRTALLDHAPDSRILCFFGHALFDRLHPMSSRIYLSDGVLYASEILRQLHVETDLIILAACESGRGHILRGDEIMGLSRAMLYAGTPALLVTLWPVHEIPTSLLINKFIEELTEIENKDHSFAPAQALSKAQQWLRKLGFADILKFIAELSGLEAKDIEPHLMPIWKMTHSDSQEPPPPDGQLFAHPHFWSPYVLIGSRAE